MHILRRIVGGLHLADSNLIVDVALWLVLLLPVIFYTDVPQPASYGRLLVLLMILPILLLGSLIVLKYSFSVIWWRSPIWLTTLLLLSISFVASIWGVNWQRSFWGTPDRGIGLILLISLVLLVTLLLVVATQKGSWLKIFSVMSWVGAASALLAIFQRFGLPLIYHITYSGNRPPGLMGNPIFLGMLLLLTIFLTLYFCWVSSGWRRWAYCLSAVAQLVALIFTASRGPLVSFGIGLLVFLAGVAVVYGRAWFNRAKLLWISIITIGVISLASAVAWVAHIPLWRLTNLNLSDDSLRIRLLIWSILTDAIKARPVLGYGIENLQIAFDRFYRSGLAAFGFGQTVADRAHNLFMEQLVTSGWLGLAVLVGFILIVGITLLRKFSSVRKIGQRADALLLLSLMATGTAYLVSLMTAFDTVGTLIYASVILAGIIFWTAPPMIGATTKSWFIRTISILILVGCLVLEGSFLPQAVRVGHLARVVSAASRAGQYDLAVQTYDQIRKIPNPYSPFFLANLPAFARHRSATLLATGDYAEAGDMAKKGLTALDEVADVEIINSVSFHTNKLAFYVVLYHLDPSYLAEAKDYFRAAVAENPNREYLYLNWARMAIGISQFDEAKEVLDMADRLAVPPRELKFWRAFLSIRSKTVSQSDIIANLQTSIEQNIPFSSDYEPILQEIISYLVKLKRWDVAVYYQEQLVAVNPNEINNRINLSATYQALGRYDEAAAEALKVIELDPSRTKDANRFLESIGY